jgi:hypothetical protein
MIADIASQGYYWIGHVPPVVAEIVETEAVKHVSHNI